MSRITLRGKSVPVTNVHEAGHALAYLITRRRWGCEEPIAGIEIGDSNITSLGDDRVFRSLAVTNAPPFPPAMMREWERCNGSLKAGQEYGREALYRGVVRCGLDAGLDVESWVKDYVLGSAAGAAAEALFLRQSAMGVFMDDACVTDRGDAALAYCSWRGLASVDDARDDFAEIVSAAVSDAASLVRRNRKAISALAVALPRSGSFSGATVCAILDAEVAA